MRPYLRQHPGDGRLAEEEGAEDVDVEHQAHLVERQVPAQVGPARDPGVVDQDRQRAEVGPDPLDRRGRVGLGPDVADDGDPAQLVGHVRGAVDVGVEDRDPGAGEGQPPGDPGPDPLPRPGHEGHLPREPEEVGHTDRRVDRSAVAMPNR